MASTVPHPEQPPKVADLVHDIGHDLRTIAVDEIELANTKLTDFMESLVVKASVALLGAAVALIGLGMLCMVVVVVARPLIEPLWQRLLLMAIVYLAAGGGAVLLYATRLAKMRGSDLALAVAGVDDTVEAVEQGLDERRSSDARH